MRKPDPAPRFLDGNSRRSLLGQNVVKRAAMADWASKKLEPDGLEETQQLDCAEFGKQAGFKAANARASNAALLGNLLLSLVCGDPGEAKRFSELKEIHVPPAIR
jgi:hypothetical protein